MCRDSRPIHETAPRASVDRLLCKRSWFQRPRWRRSRLVCPQHVEGILKYGISTYKANIFISLQRPEFVFYCQSPVTTAFFPQFHPTTIVGGTYSGQIMLWDTRSAFLLDILICSVADKLFAELRAHQCKNLQFQPSVTPTLFTVPKVRLYLCFRRNRS